MSDDFTQLNPGTGGDYMDETGVTYPSAPTTRKRARIQLAGDQPGELAEVKNTPTTGNEYGLVVRQVVPNYPGESVVVEYEADLIPDEVETTVLSYNVPTGKTFNFIGIIGSGNVNAIFRIYINNAKIFSLRTTVANLSTSLQFHYSPFSAPEGSLIEIRGKHWTTGVLAQFESTLFGFNT